MIHRIPHPLILTTFDSEIAVWDSNYVYVHSICKHLPTAVLEIWLKSLVLEACHCYCSTGEEADHPLTTETLDDAWSTFILRRTTLKEYLAAKIARI